MAPMIVDPKNVHEFDEWQKFDRWLAKNGAKASEVWIKHHKVRSGKKSISQTEAIDVALCWGWIDAIRKGFDEQSYLQRYTPRGKKSVWSQVNVANVERLTKEGRMQPVGLAHVEAAKADGRWANAYRMASKEAPADLLAAIRASPKAAVTYEALSSQNRFALTFRVINLRTEAGRARKIRELVAMLERGETIHPQGSRATSPRTQAGAPAGKTRAQTPSVRTSR